MVLKKSFTVDWNSYEEVSSLGCQIKSRLGELNPNKISKRERMRRDLDACTAIYKTDISSVYSKMNLDSNLVYYVYAHMDTTKPIAIGREAKTTFAATLGMEYFPFYIGMGSGDRCNRINRNETHRKIVEKIRTMKKIPGIVKIIDGISELEALSIESKLIDIFGLIPYRGMLTNLDEGLNKEQRRILYPNELQILSERRGYRGPKSPKDLINIVEQRKPA